MRHPHVKLAAAVCTFMYFTTAGAVTAGAQGQQTTIVTASGPVRLPGLVLPAGRYSFETISSSNAFVIQGMDGNRFKSYVRATRTTRNKPGSVIGMWPTVRGEVPEMASWYADGGTWGFEFAEQTELSTLSAKDLGSLDQRLAAATERVSAARRQLLIAEIDREAIHAERSRVK
jgi:hypothetical protein